MLYKKYRIHRILLEPLIEVFEKSGLKIELNVGRLCKGWAEVLITMEVKDEEFVNKAIATTLSDIDDNIGIYHNLIETLIRV